MSTLARALEANGIATLTLISNREQAERIGPPRGLFCDFPLGRPLGRPLDAAYQRRVLEAAFALLPRRDGPFVVDFGERIADEVDQPLACPIPPRLDEREHPAIAEARALRPAYQRGLARSQAPQVGRVVGADEVPEALRAFCEVVAGRPWHEVAFAGGDPGTLLADVRAYYETAALGLVDHVPAARAAESWYYRTTRTGRLVRDFLDAVKDADPPFPGLFYVLPLSQTDQALF